MKTDRELLMEMRAELIQLTQMVIFLSSEVSELKAIERARQAIGAARSSDSIRFDAED